MSAEQKPEMRQVSIEDQRIRNIDERLDLLVGDVVAETDFEATSVAMCILTLIARQLVFVDAGDTAAYLEAMAREARSEYTDEAAQAERVEIGRRLCIKADEIPSSVMADLEAARAAGQVA